MDLKKELGGVADAVTKIMDEALKGNQHKIDANKNNKIDAHDFKLLRAKKEVKEESEQIDEADIGDGYKIKMKHTDKGRIHSPSGEHIADVTKHESGWQYHSGGKNWDGSETSKHYKTGVEKTKMAAAKKASQIHMKETDQVEEGYYKTMDTNRKEDERLAKKDSSPFGKPDKKKTKIATPGKFGYGYSAARHLARQGMAGVTKEETDQVEEAITKTSSGYIHHARPGVYGGSEKEKHVVDTLRGPKKSELNAIEKEKKMKKSFSEMVELYNEIGLKSLTNMISEEPDNEQFTKELKDQEAKAAGKKKQADIAKGSVQAVKVEEYVELTEDEAQILDSLSQEEFNSLTEEEQDLFIEYFQPLDEISTGAAKNYLKKAVSSSSKLNQKSAKPGDAAAAEHDYSHENDSYETKQFEKFSKRRTGIRKAITKLASAHPDNKKLATTARQAFNKIHNANYRIGMDGAKNTPDDVKHVKQQHAIIHKAVHAMKEYVEQLDELSPKTLGSYIKKAHRSGTDDSFDHGDDEHRQYGDPDDTEREKEMQDRERAIANREKGIHRAVKRLTKENIQERSLTEPEMKKKEEIVKSMKKGIAGFKERYGDRAKNVMYATATKRAMGEEVEQINEAITHGDYIITHKPYNGTDKQRHVSNDITHAYSTNQKKLGIKHSEDDDEIGPDRHITVKNKKTGEVSNHVATHNNTYKDEGQRQKISIRAHGEVTPHDEKHAKVIKSFLTQKS